MNRTVAVLAGAMATVSMMGAAAAGESDAARLGERNAITFHLASATPVQGYEAMRHGRDQTIYVSPKAVISERDLGSVEAIETRRGADVVFTLDDENAGRLAQEFGGHEGRRVAILSGARLIDVGMLAVRADGGAISGLSSAQAGRLVTMMAEAVSAPAATISLVPVEQMLQPGGSTTVDVFVQGVGDLRVYQVALTATGDTSSGLTIDHTWIDTESPDYVFAQRQRLEAADQSLARIGGVLIHGGVDATDARYLGSCTVRASADASGTFSVGIRTDGQSMLLDSANRMVRFAPGPAAAIAVSASPRELTVERD